MRRDLWSRTAIALSGSVAPLLGLPGYDVSTEAIVRTSAGPCAKLARWRRRR